MAQNGTTRPGPHNAITDVPGVLVGNATDTLLKSGVTVVTAEAPFTAAVHVMGGAPGTVETDLLAPDRMVQQADAFVLSGGSAFGLAAADGARRSLRDAGRGFAVGGQNVPIVPGAILFDLLAGGDKTRVAEAYIDLGAQALAAAGTEVPLGSAGAGTGATCGSLKGGLGSASLQVGDITVGALVAVNALGEAIVGDGPHFWAAPFEIEGEFGGLGPCPDPPKPTLPSPTVAAGEATTIAVVATDAALDKAQTTRLAVAAHDGLARALVPSHSLLDGDCVFAAATGAQPLPDAIETPFRLGHAAALCLARAVARGVFHATPAAGDAKLSWHARFG
jgi:D-aminopeptidase